MIRFALGALTGTFEEGVLSVVDGEDSILASQELLQAAIDFDIIHHEGYLPGVDASARRVLLGIGATVTESDNNAREGVIY